MRITIVCSITVEVYTGGMGTHLRSSVGVGGSGGSATASSAAGGGERAGLPPNPSESESAVHPWVATVTQGRMASVEGLWRNAGVWRTLHLGVMVTPVKFIMYSGLPL